MKCPCCKEEVGEMHFACEIAGNAGRATSDAKKLSSRLNGQKGGRPKGSKNKQKGK